MKKYNRYPLEFEKSVVITCTCNIFIHYVYVKYSRRMAVRGIGRYPSN